MKSWTTEGSADYTSPYPRLMSAMDSRGVEFIVMFTDKCDGGFVVWTQNEHCVYNVGQFSPSWDVLRFSRCDRRVCLEN